MEKLVESPFSRKSETQRSLKISEGVIGSLTQQLNEAKPTGRASMATRTAYCILKNVISKSGMFTAKRA